MREGIDDLPSEAEEASSGWSGFFQGPRLPLLLLGVGATSEIVLRILDQLHLWTPDESLAVRLFPFLLLWISTLLVAVRYSKSWRNRSWIALAILLLVVAESQHVLVELGVFDSEGLFSFENPYYRSFEVVATVGGLSLLIGAFYVFIADYYFAQQTANERSARLIREVSDRRKSDAELRKAKERYDLATRAARISVWDWNIESGEVFLDPLILDILGYEPDEVGTGIGNWSTLIHPDDLTTVDRETEKVFRKELDRYEFDARIREKKGEYRWFHIQGEPFWDETDAPIRIVATAIDISERKKVEEALDQSEVLYRDAIEVAGAVPYYMTFEPRTYPFVGEGIRDLIGCEPDEFGTVWDELLQETVLLGDLKGLDVEEGVERCIKDGTLWAADYRVRTRDGEEKWLANTAVHKRDDSGKVVGSLGIFQDVTERRRTEESLREANERFRQIAENIEEVFWIYTVEGKELLYVSPAFEKVWGRAPNEVGDSTHEDDLEWVTEYRRQADLGVVPEGGVEFRIVRPNGDIRWVRERVYPIKNSAGEIYRWSGITEDITDRKREEENNERLEEKFRHAQKLESLGILAGGIAHDFNNLLVGILGNAGLALSELGSAGPAQESIHQIEIAAKRAADLTKQMLAYSGQGRFEVRTIDLTDFVREMGDLLKVSISKNVDIQYDLDRDLPAIEVDPSQAQQIVMNLIINASEAMGGAEGAVTLSTGTVEADAAYLSESYLDDDLPAGEYVYLEVADTGEGMDQETLASVFDPFYTTKFTGRGLGLSAVLGIVRGHKGALKVSSEIDRGTVFRVLFPSVDKAVVGVPKEAASPSGTLSGTVLVVDDEGLVQRFAKKVLEGSGMTVLLASNGREAVDRFRERGDEIDMVLLDLTMPVMSGEDTYVELQRLRPDVKVVLSSGYNEREVTHRFAGKGLAGFVQKPYTPGKLVEVTRKILNPESPRLS